MAGNPEVVTSGGSAAPRKTDGRLDSRARRGPKRALISQVSKKTLFEAFQGKDSERFVHERVYRAIRHLVQSGALANGARLPSSRALAEHLRISRNSVLAAIDRLLDDGWLMARRGSGVYVSYSGPCIPEPIHSPHAEGQTGIPFSLGWASDVFPVQLWTRLQSHCWRKMPELLLQQQDRNGVSALRNAIAAHVTLTRGISCAPSQVFVATCIPAAIELAIRGLGLGGKEFWVEDPCCQSTLGALTRSGIRVVPVPVDEHGADVEKGTTLSPHAAGALLTPARQAPTGVALSDERRTRLAEWAERTGAWIFEDDFNWNGDGSSPPIPPFASLNPLRTIYFNSFNNVLFPGLRIAYLVSPPAAVDAIAAVRGSEGEVNVANQVILADFIDDGYLDEHMKHLNACNVQRRSALAHYVERELSDYIVPNNSRGGYFVCSLREITESEFLSATARNNIAIAGMSAFELRPSGRNEVILGFSQFEPGVLKRAAKSLRGVLDSHRHLRHHG